MTVHEAIETASYIATIIMMVVAVLSYLDKK